MRATCVGIAGRIIVAVGVVGVSLLYGAGVAHANPVITPIECPTEPPPDATPTPGSTPGPFVPEECTPKKGEVMSGTRLVSFNVSEGEDFRDRSILEVVAFLDSDTADAPDPGPLQLSCPAPDLQSNEPGCQFSEDDPPPSPGKYSFSWNASKLTPYNGKFSLRIEATADHVTDGPQTTTFTRQYKVDTPPQQIGPPKILATTENSVTLEWAKAAEPDVQSYTLYRATTVDKTKKPADKDFKAVLTTTASAVRDDGRKPAAYWYKVQVTRRSVVTPDTGISSPLSNRSGAGVVAGLEAPPAPRGATEPTYRRPPVIPQRVSAPPPVPDAPFSAVLPYSEPDELDDVAAGPDVPEQGTDPRGAVLPVAVGAFLVSSALALGRMPY